MIIKQRFFKAEKMKEFLHSKNAHEPFSLNHSLSPPRQKLDYNQYDQPVLNPYYENLQKLTPMGSSGKKHILDKVKSPLPREPLPPIEESPNMRYIEHKYKKPVLRGPSRSTPRLSRKIDILALKLPRNPLYNEKHIDVAPVEDNRRDMIDRAQLREFSQKYRLEFLPGYHNMNILNRCVEMLNSEDDPFILENILPNQYREYLNEAGKSKKGPSFSYSKLTKPSSTKSLKNSRGGSFFPQIKSQEFGTQKTQETSINKTKWETPSEDNRSSIHSTSFSLLSKLPLPKIDLQMFKDSLDYFKNHDQDGVFLFIRTHMKGILGEFGFCEVNWLERKKSIGYVTKLFIPRAYRKMRLVFPIALKLFEQLFKTLKLDKIVVKLLDGNTFVQNDLRVMGFKLEKLDYEDGKRMKLFSIRKVDFEDLVSYLNG